MSMQYENLESFDPNRGHGLVERLLTLHPPRDQATAQRMDEVRAAYKEAGHAMVDRLPDGPDQTLAIRELHNACMKAIAAIACNQSDG